MESEARGQASDAVARELGTLAGQTLSRAAGSADLELELAPGHRLGRFEVVELLGRGGMGAVVAAFDAQLDRHVALKFLTRTTQGEVARLRLLREARSLARLTHPNIVAVYDVGEAGGVPYIAMELVEGITLREWLRPPPEAEHAAPSRIEILDMFLAIGRALEAAHELGVVHRDFKPDNVLVDLEGRPRVVDFGLARLAALEHETGEQQLDQPPSAEQLSRSQSLTRTGALVGTPSHMAPEQWQGQVPDARGDQFSFCVALFHALYGYPPFTGESMTQLMDAVLGSSPAEVARSERVPDALHAALLRGLSKEPAQRWPSMSPLLEQLERSLASVQPGLFAGRPQQILALLLPLFWTLPITWFVLERLAWVSYSARSWALVSGTQILAMLAGVLSLRKLVVQHVGDPRVLGMPVLIAIYVLGHRGIALFGGSSLETMFAYDFLAIAGVGAIVTYLVDRRLWPTALFNLILAMSAAAMPHHAPHMWVVFSIAMPLIAMTSLTRSSDSLRGDVTLNRSKSSARRPRSSRSRRYSSGAPSGGKSAGTELGVDEPTLRSRPHESLR